MTVLSRISASGWYINKFRAFANMTVISNMAGGLLVAMPASSPKFCKLNYPLFGPQRYLELGFKGNVKSLFKQDVVIEAAQAHEKGVSHLIKRVARTEDRNRTGPGPSALGDAEGQSFPRRTHQIGCCPT